MTSPDSPNGALDRQTILVADDSGYARTRLRAAFEDDFSVIVEASDGDSAFTLFAEHRPLLVVMDQVMRGRDGLETSRLILKMCPDARIVLLTAINDRELCRRARAAGVVRVIPKSCMSELVEAVRALRGD